MMSYDAYYWRFSAIESKETRDRIKALKARLSSERQGEQADTRREIRSLRRFLVEILPVKSFLAWKARDAAERDAILAEIASIKAEGYALHPENIDRARAVVDRVRAITRDSQRSFFDNCAIDAATRGL